MTLVLIIFVFLFLGVCGLFVFLADSVFGGLDLGTKQPAIDQVIAIIKQKHLQSGKFYDLGSCRGNFVVKIAKAFSNLEVYGIDNDWFRVWAAKLRSIFLKNAIFKKADIFNTDISSADIVYLYLPQELMIDLQTKLQKELKSGALVISASVSFPSWQPAQAYELKGAELKVPKLFVYIKN